MDNPESQSFNEQRLVELAKSGDIQAFEHLINQHRAFAYSIAYSYLWEKETAEDIAQEAFVEVFLNLSHLRDNGKFRSWLATLVKRLAWRESKRSNRQELSLGQIEHEQLCSNTLHTSAENDCDFEPIWSSISDRDREILHLNVIAGYTYQDIANRLGMGESAIKSRIRRVRLKIQKETNIMETRSNEEAVFVKKTITKLLRKLAEIPDRTSSDSLNSIALQTQDKALSTVADGLASLTEQGVSIEIAANITKTLPIGIIAFLKLANEVDREQEMLEIAVEILDKGLLQPSTSITNTELGDFCAALSCLWSTGIPLYTGIKMAANRHSSLGALAQHIIEFIENGGSFADGFASNESIFRPSVRRILQIAESSGKLEPVLSILAICLWYPTLLDISYKDTWETRMSTANSVLKAWQKQRWI